MVAHKIQKDDMGPVYLPI